MTLFAIPAVTTLTQAQRYSDFNDFRLDLTIMVKNAQHFNEPSSQVYKDATLIDKSVDLMVSCGSMSV